MLFEPPKPKDTGFLLRELVDRHNAAKAAEAGHPVILIGALILDLLAIHPVADGNGRLARLLTTYELLSVGYGVARYVSLEQRIYESKNTYYPSALLLAADAPRRRPPATSRSMSRPSSTLTGVEPRPARNALQVSSLT